MFGPSPSHDLTDQLEYNRIACQKKLKEHQRRALWTRHVFASQRPVIDFVPDSGDKAIGDHSFQKEEQTMDTAERKDCGRPTKEDDEEDKNHLFEEADDLEGVRVSPILEDIIRHIGDSYSPGNRYTEMTRLWAFKVLPSVEARRSIWFATSSRRRLLKLSLISLSLITFSQT
jgi:hypothetical protein